MKIYSYRLLSGAALLCLMLAARPCLATGYNGPSNPFASAGSGQGGNPGQQVLNHGNTNLSFDDYIGLSAPDKNPTRDPYDELPIHQSNNVDDTSGQQIFDYHADNGRTIPASGVMGNPGSTGTYSQTPIGRNAIYPSSKAGQLTGLPPVTTALQAGASPQGGYYYTQISAEKKPKYSFGFGSAQPLTPYTSARYPTLPATSMGSVDINVYTGPTGKVNVKADTPDFAP